MKKPFIYDVTLRDGNQALPKPWNQEEKKKVYHLLRKLGVDGIEAGFASASPGDFASVQELAELSGEEVVISSLSRAREHEIEISWKALEKAARPRVHIVLPVSAYARDNILRTGSDQVREMAARSVAYAKKIMKGRGSVQFSGEHFGDCTEEGLEFAAGVFRAAVDAGADVINLPNTVERFRPSLFVSLVKQMADFFPMVPISVHTHNDLGMATATTVESYFAGATQLEVALNGLGERAGNTNLYEVACALRNNGVETGIRFDRILETAAEIAKLSGVPIPRKAPIIGAEINAHRSGIHQDGVTKTENAIRGAYQPFDLKSVGHRENNRMTFTSQSGSGALRALLASSGILMNRSDSEEFLFWLKKRVEEKQAGELDAPGVAEWHAIWRSGQKDLTPA